MMKHLAMLLISAGLLSAQGPRRTFTGVITDTMCGADHTHMGVKPDDRCVRECVRTGRYKFALWDGKNLYLLSDQQTPDRYAARKVKVTGVLYEKTGIIKVEKIEGM